jgi:hypothetical protein
MIKNLIKFVIYSFYSKLILIEIRLRKLFFSNEILIYTNSFGFGDFVALSINLIGKLNNKKKLLCYSYNQLDIANFYFDQNKIRKIFFRLPKYLDESYLGNNFLVKSKYFKPTVIENYINKKISISDLYYGNRKIIKYIKKRLKKKIINTNLKKIFDKETFSIFIKHYNNKKYIANFGRRQTADIRKIYKLINFLIKKNFNILILGTKLDKFTSVCKLKYNNKNKNIFFLQDISRKYSIHEQVYVALNSKGYIGSISGACSFFLMLNKKILFIDSVINYSDKMWKKNVMFLYKQIKISNRYQKIIFREIYNIKEKKIKIMENSYDEIKNKVVLLFKLNSNNINN